MKAVRKRKTTKKQFESDLVAHNGNDLYRTKHVEKHSDDGRPLWLYYDSVTDLHVGSWQAGEGWEFDHEPEPEPQPEPEPEPSTVNQGGTQMQINHRQASRQKFEQEITDRHLGIYWHSRIPLDDRPTIKSWIDRDQKAIRYDLVTTKGTQTIGRWCEQMCWEYQVDPSLLAHHRLYNLGGMADMTGEWSATDNEWKISRPSTS